MTEEVKIEESRFEESNEEVKIEQPAKHPLDVLFSNIVQKCSNGKIRAATVLLSNEDGSIDIFSTGTMLDIKSSIALAGKQLQ